MVSTTYAMFGRRDSVIRCALVACTISRLARTCPDRGRHGRLAWERVASSAPDGFSRGAPAAGVTYDVVRRVAVVVALAGCPLAGCSFSGRGTPADADPSAPDADPNAPDADPSASDAAMQLFDVAHVRSAEELAFAGTADVTFGVTAIDTSALTVSPPLASGARLYAAPQDAAGSPPELAILEVHSLVIGGVLTVRGSRPLVIIAATTISVDATILASAQHEQPGPGGAGPSEGAGAGGDGNASASCDDGGAGAAFGGGGAAGGLGCGPQPGTGSMYGTATLEVLQGGSGGGTGSQCSTGGAGGGAIQLSAGTSINLGAMIAVGGGGGGGGRQCMANVWSAGGGGGSGGAIFLQALAISGAGSLAANGGGGGGGSSNPTSGSAGNDASGFGVATGGPPAFPAGGGGNGAATSAAQAGEDDAGGNAGGGGGGVGRIVLAIPAVASVTVQSSPPYVRTP